MAYPDDIPAVPTFTDHTGSVDTAPDSAILTAAEVTEVHQRIRDTQVELGLNPSGGSATVAARLSALDATVAGKADAGTGVTSVVGLTGAVDGGEILADAAVAAALALKGNKAGETWTGTHDFSGATVTGISGGSGSGLPSAFTTRTSAYTAAAGDAVEANAAGGGFVVTLPTGPAVGAVVWVTKVDSSGNPVVVRPASGGSVGADSSAVIAAQGSGLVLVHKGSNLWQVFATAVVSPGGATVPGAPTSLVAAGGSSSASLTWAAPLPGTLPITDFVVEFKTAAASTWSTFADGVGSATAATVTGLTDGTTYNFRVSAVSAVGAGPVSATATATAGAATVPGAPTGVSGTRGNTQVVLTWSAPASNGGAAITDYVVQYSSDGTNYTTFSDGTSASTGATVTGLTNGTAYTFRVAAVNSVGQGSYSTASSAVTPATVPGAPTGVSASAGNAQATVSFTAPASNGGSAVTGYTVTSSPGGLTGTGSASPINVTGLTNGTAYTFTVTATNAVGTGSASSASSAVTPNNFAVFDDFNRADVSGGSVVLGTTPTGAKSYTGVGTPSGPTVGISSNRLTVSVGSGSGFLTVNSGISNYTVQATLAVVGSPNSGTPSLVARFQDSNNFVMIQAESATTPTTYALYKRVAGTYTSLGTLGVTPADGDVIALQCNGTTYTAFVNGTQRLQITDAAPPTTAQSVGFGCGPNSAARWDDFSVAP